MNNGSKLEFSVWGNKSAFPYFEERSCRKGEEQ